MYFILIYINIIFIFILLPVIYLVSFFYLLFKLPDIENWMTFLQEEKKLENKQKVKLIRQCPYYEEWPTLSIYELVGLIKWKKFPPGHGEFNATSDHFLYIIWYYWNLQFFIVFKFYITFLRMSVSLIHSMLTLNWTCFLLKIIPYWLDE